jgi:hypothetical protein
MDALGMDSTLQTQRFWGEQGSVDIQKRSMTLQEAKAVVMVYQSIAMC